MKRGDYPAGAVIVLNDKIISKASSTGITKNNPVFHAEINAITKACKKLKSRFLTGCVIYASSEPCLMCAKAMIYARIKKVVYGTEHGEYGSKRTFDILKENGIGKDIEVVSDVERKTAEEQLKRFLKKGITI